jgi:hypothetical protein
MVLAKLGQASNSSSKNDLQTSGKFDIKALSTKKKCKGKHA